MKKFLIVLSALASFSTFANDCSYRLTGDLNEKNTPLAHKLLEKKGYSLPFDMNTADYTIDVEAQSGQTPGGKLVKWVVVSVKNSSGRVLNYGEASSADDGIASMFAKSYRGLIREAIRQLPECK